MGNKKSQSLHHWIANERKTFRIFVVFIGLFYVFLSRRTGGSNINNVDMLLKSQLKKTVPAECKEELILNGSFKEGTKGWKFIGQSTGMKLVKGTEGNALSTVTREKWFFGQAQTLNKDCFQRDDIYEVSMDVQIKDYNGNFVSCDPYVKHFTPMTCPMLALKLTGKKGIKTHDLGYPVGPWKEDDWNKIYGIYHVTDDVFFQQNLEVYMTKAASGTNIIIDNVSIKPLSESKLESIGSCNQLISNGDAEAGDARFWLIKGSGDAGLIDVISPGATGKHAFHHHGDRKTNFNGMWQILNKKCLKPGSTWKISLKMVLLDSTGANTSCDKSQMGGDASCPTIMIESHTPDKGLVTANLRNEAPGHWESNEWNLIEVTFTMTEEHASKEETSIFLNNIPSSYGYKVDNFSMVPISDSGLTVV